MQIKVFSIINTIFPYYDAKTGKMKFKKRPVLVLNREKDGPNSDLTVVPISSVTHRENLNDDYDIEIKRKDYADLNLTKDISYIRVHKIFTINSKDCQSIICNDIRDFYPELMNEILNKFEKFYNKILDID